MKKAIPIQDGREMQKKQNGLGIGVDGDPAYTLDTTGAQAVAHTWSEEDMIVYDMKSHHNPQPSETVQLTTLNCSFVRGDTPLVQHNVGIDVYNASISGDVAVTMTSVTGGTTQSGPKLMVIDRAAFSQGANAQYGIRVEESEVMGTLVARGPHAVATPQTIQTMKIRRLSPLECERLQGFPDGHTMIPFRKKPAEECADGPRYKCLGNSMAVSCMKWIGTRIHGSV